MRIPNLYFLSAWEDKKYERKSKRNLYGQNDAELVLNGEYDGKTKKGLLIIVMVFNEHNEMIGTDFDERIGEKISSHKTFSTSLTLPNYEQISRVEVRIVKDPSLWD